MAVVSSVAMGTQCRLSMTFLCFLLLFEILTVQACNVGWFGTKCAYMCHCTDKKCDTTGQCIDGSKCEPGWFGHLCQYDDLVSKGRLMWSATRGGENLIQDGDDSTCHTSLTSVSIAWPTSYPFTWMRLITGTPDKPERWQYHWIAYAPAYEASWINIVTLFKCVLNAAEAVKQLTFKLQTRVQGQQQSANCASESRVIVGPRMVDIFCDVYVAISSITITGEGMKSLCSIYVSGGRNLALKGFSSQTSTLDKTKGHHSNAVDGNTDGDYEHGSCTHTDHGESKGKPYWRLYFQHAVLANRFVLYNRDTLQQRLMGFLLRTYKGKVFRTYKDKDLMPQSEYTVLEPRNVSTISNIQILATTDFEGVYLSLCEVEVYGEVVCPSGKYGLECKNDCNCANKTGRCYVSNGVCLTGCPAGYQGEGCSKLCDAGWWGDDCAQPCSNCLHNSCNSRTGRCNEGCVIGFKPPSCTEACDDINWGVDCMQGCSPFCKNSSCDKRTGHCNQGCQSGYYLPWCLEECDEGSWGENCSLPCPNNCKGNSCNAITGQCDKGCKRGFSPPLCMPGCEPGRWGEQCTWKCDTCRNGACDSITGQCLQGCIPGYKSAYCLEECDHGWWGENCTQRCDVRCKNQSCHSTIGQCNRGCEKGYIPPNCTKGCELGRWGDNCLHLCKSTCKNWSCDITTGQCNQGCVSGYQLPNCTKVCDNGTWGENCSNSCPAKCIDGLCDKTTGQCHHECIKLKRRKQPICSKVCGVGLWGNNCTKKCSDHCINKSCSSRTGRCLLGCEVGYKPPLCKDGCSEGSWGLHCAHYCNLNCKGSSCDRVTGRCDRGCASNYKLPHCAESES